MATKRGKKTNKQTVAAQRARREREEFERQQAKNGKRKRDGKEIAVIVISIIVACSLMLPSLAQIFAQPQQQQTIPTTAAEYTERYQPLVDQYQADLNADPEDAEAELNLANTYFEWGSYARMFAGDEELQSQVTDVFTKAYDAYGKFIDMEGGIESTDTESAASSRALCQFYLGNTPQAVDELTSLAEQQNYAPAWASLGMVYASTGNTDAAIDAYQKGIEADPNDENGTKSYCEQQIESLKQSQEEATDDGTADTTDTSAADTDTSTDAGATATDSN